jgi:hypothetical protein
MAKTAFYAMSSMVYVKPKTEDGFNKAMLISVLSVAGVSGAKPWAP